MPLLHFHTPAGGFAFEPRRCVIAGWTGRDVAAVQHHIEELAALGVPAPSTVPLYYRASPALLTQAADVPVLGPDSSGEAEPVLLRHGGRWCLTVGSDHTDRRVEAYSVAVSKQLCAKPLASHAWDWNEAEPHADTIRLESDVHEGGTWVPYQRGTLASIRPLASLIEGLPADVPVEDGLVLFCGTLAAIPDATGRGVRPAARMRLVLHDARLGRTIDHTYAVAPLPLVA
jgi:hypothetical protein